MIRSILVPVVFALGLAACGGGKETKSSADPAVVAEAKQVWDTRCVACHGPQGMGNGLNAASLKTKPRSFKDQNWQKETPDDRIKKVIVEGGAAVGLSVEMAPNADLAGKPAVVEELLAMIRGFV